MFKYGVQLFFHFIKRILNVDVIHTFRQIGLANRFIEKIITENRFTEK